jgi:hypothetical protein
MANGNHGLAAWLVRTRGPFTFIIGMALVVAAIWVVLGDRPTLEAALSNLRQASPWLMAAAFVLPAANLAVVSVAFWSLTRRYGTVGIGEMSALITGAWLLNHLPMRAGMIGRLTYHKAVNKIPLRASVRVVIEGVVLSVGAILASLALAWMIESNGAFWSPRVCGIMLALPLACASLVQVLVAGSWPWTLAFICRYIDALLWAARYAVVFAVVGSPIGYVEAVFLGGITQVVGLLPIAGNGLGVREWTVGVTAGVVGAAAETTGIAADLVNRGAELLVGVPLGLIAVAWVGNRVAGTRHRETLDVASSIEASATNTVKNVASSGEPSADQQVSTPPGQTDSAT